MIKLFCTQLIKFPHFKQTSCLNFHVGRNSNYLLTDQSGYPRSPVVSIQTRFDKN